MFIIRSEAELHDARQRLDQTSDLALVPTMGALHQGHLALVDAARADGSEVIVSIFVNPLQFDARSDLERYPADHDRDFAMLREAGCSLVWLPTVDAMYPAGHSTTINVAGPAEGLEGAARAGHFRGVATVVAILLAQTRPTKVWLGEKDWQQLQVVRRMIADLRVPVSVRSLPTVRASDGLALSSRNRFLTPEERRLAPLLYAGLRSAAARIEEGVDLPAALAECRAGLTREGFVVEYLVLADRETLVPIDRPASKVRLLAAVRLGSVRLLDNVDVR